MRRYTAAASLLPLILAGCGGSSSGDAGRGSPSPSPSSPSPTFDARAISAARSAVQNTTSLPTSVQGHTKDFSGRDSSDLAAVAGEYELAASDVRRAGEALGTQGTELLALADALNAVAACVSGSAGDFYITFIDKDCPAQDAQVQARRAAALAALRP